MQQAGTPMDWFSSPQHDARIMCAWERLVGGGGPFRPDAVRSIVDHSWRRCLDSRVDPAVGRAPPPVGETDLAQRRAQHALLIDASIPLMQQTRELLAQTGTVMLLTDPNGLILQQEGDVRSVGAAGEIGLMAGYNWAEPDCGTNAIGTALALQQPVQIHGAEHFCAGIKRWTCSAAVIRDPLGARLLGVIDVSGLADTYSRYCLALAVSLAGRIEGRIAKGAMARRLRLLDCCAAQFGGRDAVLLVDEGGRLVKANAHVAPALRRLGFDIRFDANFALPSSVLSTLSAFPGPSAPRSSHSSLSSRTSRSSISPVSSVAANEKDGPPWLRRARIETVREADDVLGFLVVIPDIANRRAGAANSSAQALSPPSTSSARAQSPPAPGAFENIAGHSHALRAAVAKARQLAPSQVPVLLLGETGVGKELFAQSIHRASANAGGPFVALNCGGLSRDLLASELFGYADGAFTGARRTGAIGKIEAAHGGTLFLDEIGEMPLDIQPHLLRVLEENEIYRLGENTPRKVNFRLVAATHRNLKRAIAEGAFRMDLFYRIAVTTVAIPSLRERRDDLPALIDHWLGRLCARYGLPQYAFDAGALARLLDYAWPGNVRELRNVIEGALLMAQGPLITVANLPPEIGAPGFDAASEAGANSAGNNTGNGAGNNVGSGPGNSAGNGTGNNAGSGAGNNTGSGPGNNAGNGAATTSHAPSATRAMSAAFATSGAGKGAGDGVYGNEGEAGDEGHAHDEGAAAHALSLQAVEAESIRRALARHAGNLTQVAAQLGIAKSTLYEKIRRYGLNDALGAARSQRGLRRGGVS